MSKGESRLRLRYPHYQGLEDLSFIIAAIGPQAIASFNERHMEEFGHVREGEVPEITGVRLVSYVDTPVPRVVRGFSAPTVRGQ